MKKTTKLKLLQWPLWKWLFLLVALSEAMTLLMSYLLSKLLWGSISDHVLIVGVVDSFFVSLLVVSLVLMAMKAIRRLNAKLELRNEELSEALAEIKTLRGILPICSYCKQIRNDEGYYEQIESYLAHNSEVDFSHTICPDCAEKHFPGLHTA